jgi:two-component system, chemotaxis family, response regulator Rcp1
MRKPPYKILLVEDNRGDVRLVEEALRFSQVQYQLTFCETIKAALETISAYAAGDPKLPDLILFDYNLPGGDAREVIRAAIANPALSGARKAVITSSLSPRDRESALNAGAECFIYKPPDLDSFVDEIGSVVRELLSEPDGATRN